MEEEVTVLGRLIGTSTGWDQPDTFALILYGFKPADNVNLPAGAPCLNFETGKVEYYGEDGIEQTFDLLTALANAELRQ